MAILRTRRWLDFRERPRMSAATISDRPLAAEALMVAPIPAPAPIDDHGHVRVVLVVLDHLLVELIRELGWDHAVDHPASDCRDGFRGRYTQNKGQTLRGLPLFASSGFLEAGGFRGGGGRPPRWGGSTLLGGGRGGGVLPPPGRGGSAAPGPGGPGL